MGSGFVDQCCGFERALSRADHDNALTSKAVDIAAFITVHDLLGREVAEGGRLALERADAGSDDNFASANLFAVFQNQPEGVSIAIDALNVAFVEIRTKLMTEPAAVFDEGVEWYRCTWLEFR